MSEKEPYQVLKSSNDVTFSHYDQYVYLYYTLPVIRKAKIIVETGLGLGLSTRIFLEALSHLPDPETRTLHTFDMLEHRELLGTSQQMIDEGTDDATAHPTRTTPPKIRQCNFPAKWVLHVCDSTHGGEFLPSDTKIDVLYLDSDHSYSSVMAELKSFGRFLDWHSLIWAHDSMPLNEHASFTQGVGKPSDTYYALRDWGDANGYRILLYPHPNGITLAFK